MKNQYIKNMRVAFMVILLAVIFTGCGKGEPASAVSAPTTTPTEVVEVPTSTVAPEPTETVVPEPTDTVAPEPTDIPTPTPTINTEFTLISDREISEFDREWLKRLEETHISSYLDGYSIEERHARPLDIIDGCTKFELTYICEKNDSKLTFRFGVIVKLSYNADDVGDNLSYDYIKRERMIDGCWEIIGYVEFVKGLNGYLN